MALKIKYSPVKLIGPTEDAKLVKLKISFIRKILMLSFNAFNYHKEDDDIIKNIAL